MFELSQDHEDFRKVVRDFAEREVAPHVAQWDKDHHFPADLVPKMGDLGLFGLVVPEEFGGSLDPEEGGAFTSLCVAIEELGLISPERHGTTRIYHRRDKTRLSLILRGKRLGFPLEEIRTIIDLYDAPRGRRSQLEYVLGQIDERRTDLEQRRRDLDAALGELDRFEESCRSDLGRLT